MILKYTDYKKEQALWLQKTDSKRTNYGTTSEQYFIECYLNYLKICGFKNEYLFSEIYKNVFNKINSSDSHFKKGDEYIEEVEKNVNEIMDNLTKDLQ